MNDLTLEVEPSAAVLPVFDIELSTKNTLASLVPYPAVAFEKSTNILSLVFAPTR